MKLEVAVNETIMGNTGETGEFRIRNSAKAFSILSSGLYSNKIRAIIRELSCNAVDSHVAAGKVDVPFEVHLPTTLEPYFAVRDFGTGLSGDQVTNIYTTYFESTKTDSNAFIGALGLGSKSPFSYTENFTITAIKDGTKRIYSAFINENGIPCVSEMHTELTDEGNGVEVKFSVTDRTDYNSFRSEARSVFTWFKNRPIITGVSDFEHYEQQYSEANVVPGVHVRAGSYDRGPSTAVMGNIAYPLNEVPSGDKHFGHLAGLLNCNLVIEFEIGEVDFAASREELSYVPLTINSIKKKLELLNANLASHIAGKADAISNEWERAVFLRKQASRSMFKAAVVKYVTDTKFELFDVNEYYGNKSFKFTPDNFAKRQFSMLAFRVSHGSVSKVTFSHVDWVGNTRVDYLTIPVDSDVVIVLNDLKTGCGARAKHHFQHHNNRKPVVVYCISHSSDDMKVRQAEYDKLIAELHNPPVVVKASSLIPAEKKKSISSQGIMRLKLRPAQRSGYSDAYTWASCADEEFDENTTYCYVPMSNYEALSKDLTKPIRIGHIRALMDNSRFRDISDMVIYGVRKHKLADIKGASNWVLFEDKLQEKINSIPDDKIKSLIFSELVDNSTLRAYTTNEVATIVGKDSAYSVYHRKYGNIRKHYTNSHSFSELCSIYGRTIELDKLREEFEKDKLDFLGKYPLMKYLRDATHEHVAEYVTLIDKTENTK